MNRLALSGVVQRLEPLRYTPAGLPVRNLVLQHSADAIEAGFKRKVECEVEAVMVGELANKPLAQGAQIQATGFLAKRSAKSTALMFHIQNFERIQE